MSRSALLLGTSVRAVSDRADSAVRVRTSISLAPVMVAALAVAVSLPVTGRWCNLSPDSFTYLTMARALYETGGFPSERLMAPPGLPILLAPLMGLGEMPMLAVRLMALACFTATGVLTWYLFRREIGERAAMAAAMLVTISGPMVNQSTFLLSETFFTPLALACLLIASRWHAGRATSTRELFLAGLLAAFASLVRSAGLVLAPMMLLGCMSNASLPRRRKIISLAVLTAGFVIPQAAWSIRQRAYPTTYGYGTIWTTPRGVEGTDETGTALHARRLATFGPQRLGDLTQAVIPNHLGWRAISGGAATVARWLVGGGLVVIALVRFVRRRSPTDAFFLMTIAMLALWPWNEGVRLVVPLIPLVMGYVCWLFIRTFAAVEKHRWPVRGLIALATMFISAHAFELPYAIGSIQRQGERTAERVESMQRVAEWQLANLPADAEIVSITKDGDNAKLVLIGASYLSRRPIAEFVECGKRGSESATADAGRYAFVDAAAPPDAVPTMARMLASVETFGVYRME